MFYSIPNNAAYYAQSWQNTTIYNIKSGYANNSTSNTERTIDVSSYNTLIVVGLCGVGSPSYGDTGLRIYDENGTILKAYISGAIGLTNYTGNSNSYGQYILDEFAILDISQYETIKLKATYRGYGVLSASVMLF